MVGEEEHGRRRRATDRSPRRARHRSRPRIRRPRRVDDRGPPGGRPVDSPGRWVWGRPGRRVLPSGKSTAATI